MVWLVYLVAFLLGLYFLNHIFGRETFPFHAKKALLTDAELDFFHVLECAVPDDAIIAPKVRLGDVIGCSDADWSSGHGPKISAKHLDFVLIDRRTSRILLAIELDDSSHVRSDRQARDRFLNQALAAAQVPLLRVKTASSYSQTELRDAIEESLHD